MVVIGAIMTILDATIVNVALPTLGQDLHTSISTIQWVPTVYLLAFASVIPLTGWLASRFGAKRVWLASLGLLLGGSLLAGLSPSIGALIGRPDMTTPAQHDTQAPPARSRLAAFRGTCMGAAVLLKGEARSAVMIVNVV